MRPGTIIYGTGAVASEAGNSSIPKWFQEPGLYFVKIIKHVGWMRPCVPKGYMCSNETIN